MPNTTRKTPKDATEFEREQLRFFLTKDDAPAVLAEVNPSLSWLPILAELRLIDVETQLSAWIEKNFADPDAVREVAANINFFCPETAAILASRLNLANGISAVLRTSWQLIIRHMRAAKRGRLRDEWFEIEPCIKRGEKSPDLLERLAQVLRPQLKVSNKFRWSDDLKDPELERPTDLIAIDFEIEDAVTGEEVLSAWPDSANAEIDYELLGHLAHALSTALHDAIEAGVENDRGFGVSDKDVPSVAKHDQNAYRTGFHSIVRVMAELWTRMARKDPSRARVLVELWRKNPLRLIRRLALFAAADRVVPADIAAQVLTTVPLGELFLTNSSVEVYRLIDSRWRNFTREQHDAIEGRIVLGPPDEWFRCDKEQMVDRCRYDLLGHMERSGIQLGATAQAVLDDIRARWPNWQLRPDEQAGFHIWHGGASEIVGDSTKLRDVPDAQLVVEAKRTMDAADFFEGDAWQALCKTDPPRALRGLAEQAAAGQWPTWAWRPYLWTAQTDANPESVTQVARLLLASPAGSFAEIAADASWWLNEAATTIDDDLLWQLWDRIFEASTQHNDTEAFDD